MLGSLESRRGLIIALILFLGTLAIVGRITGNDFISYDDGIYVTENPHVNSGLSLANVTWAFRTGHGGNWHPLTWISHMLDVQLFGLRPGWHHASSLLLHALNGVLLFYLFQRMTGAMWPSAFVAALFAWHPLHVESVAWASERKDVLSAFFFLLTLIFYQRFARSKRMIPTGERNPSSPPGTGTAGAKTASLNYALSLISFAAGLMSKPMLVTVPFVLLLLDYWPLRRFGPETQIAPEPSAVGEDPAGGQRWVPGFPLLIEKLPFLVLAIISCFVTVLVQKAEGAVVTVDEFSFWERLGNALHAYALYLGKTVWPTGLSLFYPLHADDRWGPALAAALLLVGVSVLAGWQARKRPHLLAGWFWFLGMLVPVIGLVQVGMQSMADRYSYLPLIGIFAMAGFEAFNAINTWKISRESAGLTAAAILAVCAALTFRQAGFWRDSEAIFGHTLQVTRDNYIALNNHALAMMQKGRVAEAASEFQAAVDLQPKLDAARCGLGEAYMQQGKFEAAAEQFEAALALKPRDLAARLQMGVLLGRQGKLEEAAAVFAEILREHPDDIGARNNWGNVLALQGKNEEARGQFLEAVRLKPNHVNAFNNLAICSRKLGRIDEAIRWYRKALRIKPDFVEAMNNLAWILATSREERYRNGGEAMNLAMKVCELTRYQNPVALLTLAAAYAEAGQFTEASSFIQTARQLAPNGPLALRSQEMLALFQAGKPYRE